MKPTALKDGSSKMGLKYDAVYGNQLHINAHIKGSEEHTMDPIIEQLDEKSMKSTFIHLTQSILVLKEFSNDVESEPQIIKEEVEDQDSI